MRQSVANELLLCIVRKKYEKLGKGLKIIFCFKYEEELLKANIKDRWTKEVYKDAYGILFVLLHDKRKWEEWYFSRKFYANFIPNVIILNMFTVGGSHARLSCPKGTDFQMEYSVS